MNIDDTSRETDVFNRTGRPDVLAPYHVLDYKVAAHHFKPTLGPRYYDFTSLLLALCMGLLVGAGVMHLVEAAYRNPQPLAPCKQ